MKIRIGATLQNGKHGIGIWIVDGASKAFLFIDDPKDAAEIIWKFKTAADQVFGGDDDEW